MRRRCNAGECVWKPLRSFRERCINCNTKFPCEHACHHQDCQDCRVENMVAFAADHKARNDRPAKFPMKGFSLGDDQPEHPGEY